MRINITDEIISEFFSGAIVVLALIGMGAFLMFLLKGLKRSFPFTRLSLAMGMAPLSLINFLDYGESPVLFLFSLAAALLGITIDGINHLLTPKERVIIRPADAREEDKVETTQGEQQEAQTAETRPGVIVWEKAE